MTSASPGNSLDIPVPLAPDLPNQHLWGGVGGWDQQSVINKLSGDSNVAPLKKQPRRKGQ